MGAFYRARTPPGRLPPGMMASPQPHLISACAPGKAPPPTARVPELSDTRPASPSQAAEYVPLQKGSYWRYEISGPLDTASGYKQVLVTDEAPAADQQGATDTVVSVIDHSIPREERPDEPTIIRRSPAGLECLDCGGLFLPARLEDRTAWSGGDAGQGLACRLVDAELAYRAPAGDESPATIVSCADPATGVDRTQVYARGVGPVPSVVTGSQAGKGLVHYERPREHRVLDPAAPFPALPSGP